MAYEAVYARLGAQDAEALTALSERYPAFEKAYAGGRVGHHLLAARGDDLAKEDAFELVAASAEHYRALGYEYLVTEATNQWTRLPCARATSRWMTSRRARTGSSLTKIAEACSM